MGNRTSKGKSTDNPETKESEVVYLFKAIKVFDRPGRAAVLLSLEQDAAEHARLSECAYKTYEEMISEFITSTCQVLPKSFSSVRDHMEDFMPTYGCLSENYLIMCGSCVEFYIRPLNSCIDDVDFLMSNTSQLAFSGNAPTLPRDRSGHGDAIQCYKIEPYEGYPGFVRLRIWGTVDYNWKSKNDEFNESTLNEYFYIDIDRVASMYYMHTPDKNPLPNSVCGPAIKFRKSDIPCPLGRDLVYTIWCHEWPKEAQCWLTRPRKNGWPTADTIAKVVQSGCHVVYIQHRSCRAAKSQWRLSFSVAEVILLQSWTKTQQIVYHLLRFFAKRVLIEKDCPKEDEVLCPYQLKTLMLWTCEEMPPEWWNSTFVIAICCELLRKLSDWLKKRHCPNYFIPEANLFFKPSSSTMLNCTNRRLQEFGNSYKLCRWFTVNYIAVITQTDFEIHVSLEKTTEHLMIFMLRLFDFWKVSEAKSLDALLSLAFTCCDEGYRQPIKYGFFSGLRLSLKIGNYSRCLEPKISCRLIDLPTIENVLCFTYYDILLLILHIACGFCYDAISLESRIFAEFVSIISMKPKTIRSEYHNFPRAITAKSSRLVFLRAQNLMENLTGSNSLSEFQLVSVVSKELLKKALEYDAFESSGITPAALAYFAGLHFAAAEYQQTLRYCTEVLSDQTSQEDKETLNAGCLLFIDDVARIVGLYLLHAKIIVRTLSSCIVQTVDKSNKLFCIEEKHILRLFS